MGGETPDYLRCLRKSRVWRHPTCGFPRQLAWGPVSATFSVDLDLYAPILVFSSIAVALSVVALVRGAPAQLTNRADTALKIAQEAQDSMISIRSEVQTYLGAIEDERERTVKAAARARSAQQRVENGERPPPATRTDLLSELRQRAGLT